MFKQHKKSKSPHYVRRATIIDSLKQRLTYDEAHILTAVFPAFGEF